MITLRVAKQARKFSGYGTSAGFQSATREQRAAATRLVVFVGAVCDVARCVTTGKFDRRYNDNATAAHNHAMHAVGCDV